MPGRDLLITRRGLLRLGALGLGGVTAGGVVSACSSSPSGGAAAGSAASGSAVSGSAVSGSAAGPSGRTPSGRASAAGSASVPTASDAAIAPRRVAYGADRSQYGELYLPPGPRRRGLVVVIHGGFWLAQYTAGLGAPLALDLARRGWAAWNLEYRRVGNGGGWPGTFTDVAAGIDVLGSALLHSAGLDLSRVVAVGHSAGGQLAVWAAARAGLPASAPGSGPKVRVHGVVSQAGVLDLVRAADTGLGGPAAADVLGGRPSAVPGRYALASPVARLPIGVPVRCVHSPDDGIVPLEQSTRYVRAATEVGDDASLVRTTGDHFALITVGSPAWTATVAQLPALLD